MRQLKTLLMVMLVLGALVLFPCLSWAGEQQQVFFREGVTDKDKAFVQKVVKLKESTNSREYLAGLRELALTDQKVVRYQYRVEEKNGKQQVRLGRENLAKIRVRQFAIGDVIVMGGTQADLTLDFKVTKGFDEWHTDGILLDYDFYWSNCEELDGTDNRGRKLGY